jgi:acetyl esterase/lipase
MITDWSDAYANGKYIARADSFPPRWAARAAAYRAVLGERALLDLPYGDQERQRFDLLLPEATPKGLAVFVHGGYWMAFDKSIWSHLAAGANARGWAVCLPSYTLAPQARLPDMTNEILWAITEAAAQVPGPIRLAGHSAGGHLVTRIACADVALPVADRLQHVLSISGLHDLRPLLRTDMNETLRLDQAGATAESAALQTPRAGVSLTTWVGADERPEFIRQSDLLANIWTGLGIETRCHQETGKHHFNVIEPLAEADSTITGAFVGD